MRPSGPLDVTSRATTAGSLALVRAAQGRHEEAEALFGEALETLAGTEFRLLEDELLENFAQFLRDRDREDEAAALDERREELLNAREELGPNRLM